MALKVAPRERSLTTILSPIAIRERSLATALSPVAPRERFPANAPSQTFLLELVALREWDHVK